MTIDQNTYEHILAAQEEISIALKRVDDSMVQDTLFDIFAQLEDLLAFIEAERSF